MRKSKLLSVVYSLLTALLVLTGAIAVPLLCRPFYYAHIEALDLPAQVGLSVEQIKTAFNEMMDYCMGAAPEMQAGVFPFSEEGAAHFADVRVLFRLDLLLLGAGLLVLVILLAVCHRRELSAYWFGGWTPAFWGAVGLGASFLTVGGLAALDFERAFVVFHHLMFPGKENWLFDIYTDPIILILPEEFFRNCAILILSILLLSCAAIILHALHSRRTHRT